MYYTYNNSIVDYIDYQDKIFYLLSNIFHEKTIVLIKTTEKGVSLMSQSKKGNRYQISFKENLQELELMNFMLEQAELIGISSYIKMLIKKDMQEKENK